MPVDLDNASHNAYGALIASRFPCSSSSSSRSAPSTTRSRSPGVPASPSPSTTLCASCSSSSRLQWNRSREKSPFQPVRGVHRVRRHCARGYSPRRRRGPGLCVRARHLHRPVAGQRLHVLEDRVRDLARQQWHASCSTTGPAPAPMMTRAATTAVMTAAEK